MIVSNATAQGARPYQEDYHAYYSPPKGMAARGTLLLLADGMGGMAGGATASLMAVEHFRDAYYSPAGGDESDDDVGGRLSRILQAANERLLSASKADVHLTGMGTTLIAAVIRNNSLYWVSVGDSHLYLLREGQLRLLTEDQSIGGELQRKLAAGEITQEYAKTFDGQHHKLLHYLGNKNFGHFDLSRTAIDLKPEDRVVMCTDGLYGTLPEQALTEILLQSEPAVSANALVKAALELRVPEQDNMTVQVVSANGGWTTAEDSAPAAPASRRPSLKLVLLIALVAAAVAGYCYWFWAQRRQVVAPQTQQAMRGQQNTGAAALPGVRPQTSDGAAFGGAARPPVPPAQPPAKPSNTGKRDK